MARKFCEYCTTYSDAAYNKCPNCNAPLKNDIIPDQNSLKEVITAAVNSGLRSATDAIGKASAPKPTTYQPPAQGYGARMCHKAITLLLLVVGVFGAHKFYEGKPAWGVFYIFTGGGFIVCLIIDFLVLLTKPDTYPGKEY